ncbi:MAG: CDP-alcohol phosphatidyltransferase family protein [Actinomycetia bacterium]|nr:CDP-alcohol phosphatidyltransferase family protein [Actinomycetes bacterium]
MSRDTIMQRYQQQVPDALTFSRMAFTTMIIALVMRDEIPVFLTAGMMLLVFVTDILDGVAARRYHSESASGAVLDIVADAYYVLGVSFAMAMRGIMPALIVVCMVVEFTIFLVTSPRLKRSGLVQVEGHSRGPLFFDKLGRTVVVYLYFILPTVMLTAWWLTADQRIAQILTVLCVVLTLIVIVSRLILIQRTAT